jgi:glucan phosphoethanolaminetransferase (alkaline phosphatase superfamily)
MVRRQIEHPFHRGDDGSFKSVTFKGMVLTWIRRPVSRPALALAVLSIGLPLAFLVIYAAFFRYDLRIAAVGVVMIHAAIVALVLLTLSLAWLSDPQRSRLCQRLFGLGLGAIMTATALDFLPPLDRTSWLLAALGAAAGGLAAALLLTASLRIARRIVPQATLWLAAGRRTRRMGAALAVTATWLVTLAAVMTLWIARGDARTTYGEPLTTFLRPDPIANVLAIDQPRVIAAIEDHAARAHYPVPATPPVRSVVLIMVDSLRADRMGVYGYGRDTTPFLQSLHRSGRLHRVDMALSTCSESFCGIASSLAARPFHELSTHSFTLPDVLRRVGYRSTFMLSGDHRGWPYLHAFYAGLYDQRHEAAADAPFGINDDRNVLASLARIEPAGSRPGFFYFFLMSSHVLGTRQPAFERYQPTPTASQRILAFWNEMGGAAVVDGRFAARPQLSAADLDAVSNHYDNGVLQADDMIRQIFAGLEAKGHLDDSIVVIVGDHGEGLGEKGHVGHGRFLYQGDIHVPLLIYDRNLASYRNGAFATHIDIAPTILARLGLPVPPTWPGHALTGPPRDRVTLHQTRRGRTPCFAAVRAAGEALLKHIRCGSSGQRMVERTYDLRTDPAETVDLSSRADIPGLSTLRAALGRRAGVLVNRCWRPECQD